MSYDLGDLVPLGITITDADGQPANAGAVTVTITLPDGTAEPHAVSPAATGQYDYDFATTQAGRHAVRWVATGDNASAYADVFDVTSAEPPWFVSIADAKRYLRKTNAADDELLAAFVEAGCLAIEDRIGPVTPRTETYVPGVLACGTTVILPRAPVIAVTALVCNGTVVPEWDVEDPTTPGWRLNPGAGLVDYVGGRWPYGYLTVSYRVGQSPVLGNVRLAALELISHLWRSSQLNASPARPGLSGDDQIVVQGQAYAFPNRCRELLGIGKLPTNSVQVG